MPAWAKDAVARILPAYNEKVQAVVLLQEEHLTVGLDGQRSIRERGVIRLLQRTREPVSAYRTWDTRSGKIRSAQAWVISPSGAESAVRKDQIVDRGLSQKYSYEEVRAKSVECPSSEAGTVFVWEFVEEEKTVFTQYHYNFQERMPVITSRFALTVPPGWEARATLFNTEAAAPVVAGQTQTWELQNLPWIEPEDYSPSIRSIVPAIGVTVFSPAESALRMRDWKAVSSWVSSLVEDAAAPNDAVTAKAVELTRGAASEADKIRAIASFVQGTNYVSVQLNLNKGGGYTPHAAREVLRRNYGDCKDKATLMRSLLGAVGIQSWLAVIYSGDRFHVRPEWPSPLQFNHAIIAVRASPATELPTIVEHPSLGRLLFFDPTASSTRLGELPADEQGSYSLVLAGDKGDLLRAPVTPLRANRIESEIEGSLDGSTSGLTAKLTRRYFGNSAAYMRSASDDPRELQKSFESAFSRRLGGVDLGAVVGTDVDSSFEARLDFRVRQFGQLVQNKLLVLRPGTLVTSNDYGFTNKPRKAPIQIYSRVRHDHVRIQIPPGFTQDELPDPVKLESPYGAYSATWQVNGGEVAFTQDLAIRDFQVPAAEYNKLKEFFEQIAGNQHSAVVLVAR